MYVIKTRFHRITFIAALCFFGVFNPFVFARTINLPDEYSSIQEAVEAASSGDVIQVNQHGVTFLCDDIVFNQNRGIRIINKDLQIIGALQNERVKIVKEQYYLFYLDSSFFIPAISEQNAIVVENSNVLIKNIVLEKPEYTHYFKAMDLHLFSASPIQVISGKLSLIEVDMAGVFKVCGDLEIHDSIIRGHARYDMDYHRDPHKESIPAIYIYNRQSPNVSIIDTEILCDLDVGARALMFEGIENARIQIDNTKIVSGIDYSKLALSSPDFFLPNAFGQPSGNQPPSENNWRSIDTSKGWSGVSIANCTNVVLNMRSSEVVGGGGPYKKIAEDDKYIPGGDGIEIMDSNRIVIQEGQFVGGNGVIGGFGSYYELSPPIIINSGDGGNGLFITNSTVTLNNVTALGGRGGEGDSANGVEPGVDGQPIYYDENSKVVIGSAVEDWEIYR